MMRIVNAIKGWFKRESAASSFRLGAADSTVSVTSDASAMRVATVFRCVKLLSEIVASLPMQYLRRRGDIFVEHESDPLHYLLAVQPDEHLSAFDFFRQIIVDVLLDGNAYIVPFYDDNLKPRRLALCRRGSVIHDTINDVYSVCDRENGINDTFDESEIIHIKGLTLRDSKKGVSVLTYARLTFSIAATGDKETQSRFANGGNVHGIISNDSNRSSFGLYDDGELNSTAERLDEQLRNGARIISTPGDAKFNQISMSSADLQFLESRKFTVLEICRFFGVHPSFVYGDTSTNYKSAEQANVAFLSQTLNPLMRSIEAEFRRKLVPRQLYHKYKFSFDRRDLYACDLEGLMKHRINRLQIGSTVNEIRMMDNLPPVKGGDVPLVSANLKTIDALKGGNTTVIDNGNDGKQS